MCKSIHTNTITLHMLLCTILLFHSSTSKSILISKLHKILPSFHSITFRPFSSFQWLHKYYCEQVITWDCYNIDMTQGSIWIQCRTSRKRIKYQERRVSGPCLTGKLIYRIHPGAPIITEKVSSIQGEVLMAKTFKEVRWLKMEMTTYTSCQHNSSTIDTPSLSPFHPLL